MYQHSGVDRRGKKESHRLSLRQPQSLYLVEKRTPVGHYWITFLIRTYVAVLKVASTFFAFSQNGDLKAVVREEGFSSKVNITFCAVQQVYLVFPQGQSVPVPDFLPVFMSALAEIK